MTRRGGLASVVCILLLGCLVLGQGSDRQWVEKQLERIFDDPSFHRAAWGVKIQSLKSGEVLYERNADRYFLPASNMKLVTALAAIEAHGLDHRFETVVGSDGKARGGVLRGNLIVVGGGDPTLGARLSSPDPEQIEEGDAAAVFREWAQRLKEMGIRRIAGDIVGVDDVFDDVGLGSGWSWDDLPYGYSAEIGGLQFNENNVFLQISAGDEAGQPARFQMRPGTSYLEVSNRVITVAPWEETEIRLQRTALNRVAVEGTMAISDAPIWRSVTVENPTLYFTTALAETLRREGIEVGGRPSDADLLDKKPELRQSLFTHRSPDLRYILQVLLKISQNLYAETLVRSLDPRPFGKSYERGRRQVERLLRRAGIPGDAYVLADGSGLSRYSFVTPDMLVRLLRHAHRSDYAQEFREFLPLGGVDGTLDDRFKGTPAEGKVHAKTGTLSHVRALAGYVFTAGGEPLAFAMIVNNYTQPRPSAEYLQDLALQFLASLER